MQVSIENWVGAEKRQVEGGWRTNCRSNYSDMTCVASLCGVGNGGGGGNWCGCVLALGVARIVCCGTESSAHELTRAIMEAKC